MARQLELEDPWFDFSDYNPRTRQLHEITIRRFYGFRVFDPEARRLLLKEIADMVRSQLKPKLMLWLCVDALVREKIEVPSYTRLTKLILGAINRRKQELASRLELPNLSRRTPDRLHTSSDGQKFEVRADSLNANY